MFDRFDQFNHRSPVLAVEHLTEVAVALEATLELLPHHPGFARYVAEADLYRGFDMPRGWVSDDLHFLAIVEAGHYLWCMHESRLREFFLHELRELVTMPQTFDGDFKDIAGAIMAWTADPDEDK
ncbi:MAG TPA: hypothetical protein VLF21_01915 [Candidatus Saccharimonadales bacterium]|nr:hypothetical protein [Candidatus Saccharimonadales bacterium]